MHLVWFLYNATQHLVNIRFRGGPDRWEVEDRIVIRRWWILELGRDGYPLSVHVNTENLLNFHLLPSVPTKNPEAEAPGF